MLRHYWPLYRAPAKIELRGMRFEIEADYDPSGLLGRDPSMRPGFQELRVKVESMLISTAPASRRYWS